MGEISSARWKEHQVATPVGLVSMGHTGWYGHVVATKIEVRPYSAHILPKNESGFGSPYTGLPQAKTISEPV